ncbi:hypothetical protein ACFQ8W_01720 [Streptomyces sp. NPDC056508]|uniref:hypothetical protein n=1 Tax=Streptomyces sp. NPDC056508 TaxID=3345845 RepID=UPI0036859F32
MLNKINFAAITLLFTAAAGGMTTGYLIRHTDVSPGIALSVLFLTVIAIQAETRANRLAAAKTTSGA